MIRVADEALGGRFTVYPIPRSNFCDSNPQVLWINLLVKALMLTRLMTISVLEQTAHVNVRGLNSPKSEDDVWFQIFSVTVIFIKKINEILLNI